MTLASGSSETISHYRLIEPLGRGAMGEVWLAEDTELPRKVAVKLLPRHLADDHEAIERLMREARAAASVDHPAVVTVYDAGIANGRPFLVMQHVEGETLEERLTRGPLDVSEAVAFASQVADALAEVHALGIVHRDLKPANVVMSPRGPKVLDFGVASVKGSPRVTATGTAVGTPLAMSPEQIAGKPPDNRTDLWSLGVMLYQALTGKLPFEGTTFESLLHEILNAQPQPPSALRAGIGTDLDFIVMKLLRKDPALRYARAEELIADLRSSSGGSSVERPPADAPPRLAVLPFEVMSTNPDDEFVALGLVEDLIVDLARLGGVHVAPRAEVLPYANRTVPPRTLARELGADFIVLGSVRRAGNRGRISTQLVRASDGHTLWAERFDRTLEDLFDVQAEVSRRIVDSLQIALKPGEREMLDRAPTRNTEAYTLYLRARQQLDHRGREANFLAEELLKQAIALDSRFALAHAVLGECYARRALSWYAGREVTALALPCAERALEIEPDLLEGHLVRAMVFRINEDPERLLEIIERIISMDPDHTDALDWAAWSYMAMGNPEKAVGILERITQHHPDRPQGWTHLVNCLDMLGLEDKLAAALATAREKALDELRRHPERTLARTMLASYLVHSGEIEAGVQQAERAIAAAPGDNQVRYNAACTFARAGLKERAMAELKEGIRNLPSYLTDWPRRDPDLKTLHDDPEFIRLFGRAEPRA